MTLLPDIPMSMSASKPYVPPRFRLSAFRIYETAIQAIVLNYPSVVEIDPRPFSAETFCARCRDAITAYLSDNGRTWQSIVPRETLRLVRLDVVFVNAGSVVRVGPKRLLAAQDSTQATTPQFQTTTVPLRASGLFVPSPSITTPTNNPTKDDLVILLQKLSSGALVGPITLTGAVPLADLEALVVSGQFDVEYKLQPDNSILLF